MIQFSSLLGKNSRRPQKPRYDEPREATRKPTFDSSHKGRGERRSGRHRGSALVETALCLTFVLLPVTLGGFQFAMIYMTQHSMQQVARESARWAAVHYTDDNFDGPATKGDAPLNASDPNGPREDRSFLNYVKGQAAANGIDWRDISGDRINKKSNADAGEKGGSVTISPASNQRVSGQPLTVVITYPMRQRSFMGDLLFQNNDGSKISPLNLRFLKSDFVEASTTLME